MDIHPMRLARPWRVAACVVAGLLAAASPVAFAQGQGQCPPQAIIQSESQSVDEGVTVKLNGQPSKPNNAAFLWEYISGPSPITFLPSATVAKPEFVAPEVDGDQQLVIRLTVRGCSPLQASSSTITINIRDLDGPPANTAPSAAAIAVPPLAGEGVQVTLDGNGSGDPEHQPLSYAWTQVNGPAVTLTGANSASATFIAPNTTTTGVTLEFQLTVTDPGGLQDSTNVVVNIVFANDAPFAALSCPAEVDEGDAVVLDGSASSDHEDDFDGVPLVYTWSQSEGPPNIDVSLETGDTVGFTAPTLGTGDLGGVVFRLHVADRTGAYSEATCGVFIRDVTAPVIAGAGDRIVEATSPAGANVDYGMTAADNVEGDVTADLACTPPSGSAFALDVPTQVDCSVADTNGNTATASFQVVVRDRTKPVIDPHDAVAVEATSPAGAAVEYDVPGTFDVVDVDLLATCAPPSGSTFALGTHAVTCDATDASGNAADPTTFNVTVHDTTPPVVTVPASITAEATSPQGVAVPFAASAEDIVDGAVTPVCKVGANIVQSGDLFPLGASTVECAATDNAGNTGSANFTITVVDTTPPTLSLPADITEEATSPAGATVTYTASASDLVSGNVPATCAPVSGSTFALGTTTVHCSATDAASNQASGEFTVTVRDTTPPAIAPHADVIAEATSAAGAIVNYALPATSDIVDGTGFAACVATPGTQFPLGTSVVTCNATDNAGNIATSTTFNVIVRDTTPPAIATHDAVLATATASSQAIVAYTNPSANDLVDGVLETTCAPPSGSTFHVGTTAVTCSVTDAAGNTATSTFDVIVSYAFTGFFRPVDNLPTLNVVKAGQAIPVKFSLGGNQGMAIFATGYPRAVMMSCSGTVQDSIEETVTAGGSSLQYDATSGQYIYVWKSDKSWAGSCRQLQLKFADGSTQAANFSFTR